MYMYLRDISAPPSLRRICLTSISFCFVGILSCLDGFFLSFKLLTIRVFTNYPYLYNL